jgi:hypothetical protein
MLSGRWLGLCFYDGMDAGGTATTGCPPYRGPSRWKHESPDFSRGESQGNPQGKIHLEVDGAEVLCEIPDMPGTRLVSIKHVVGVIYTSRSGRSRVFWREPRKLWGQASPHTFTMLLESGARVMQPRP